MEALPPPVPLPVLEDARRPPIAYKSPPLPSHASASEGVATRRLWLPLLPAGAPCRSCPCRTHAAADKPLLDAGSNDAPPNGPDSLLSERGWVKEPLLPPTMSVLRRACSGTSPFVVLLLLRMPALALSLSGLQCRSENESEVLGMRMLTLVWW
jgi:hypothetical protein